MKLAIAALALLLALTPAAHAKTLFEKTTLLETVLYLVSGYQAHETASEVLTVRQHGVTLEANRQTRVVSFEVPITIRQLDRCLFLVDWRLPDFPAVYTVNFAASAFGEARVTRATNALGRNASAIALPSTRYCFIDGKPYLNVGLAPGACADTFLIDHGRAQDAMFAALGRLRALCAAPPM